MSSLLFLLTVAAFVVLAYWAYRNDGMGANESGSGVLAMQVDGPKTKPVPKWKKAAEPPAERSPLSLPAGPNPGWKRDLRRGG
jgi:hypothetical protein